MNKEDNLKRTAYLKNIVLNMPEKPGTYQFYDNEKTIIYVGKAKNLKRRVSSYFHKEVDRFKTKVLVSKIHDISYSVVKTEEDALLIENQLIKQYKPKYNVLLKDGKTYPSICVTNEYSHVYSKHVLSIKRYGTFLLVLIAILVVCMLFLILLRRYINRVLVAFLSQKKVSNRVNTNLA